MIVAFALRVDVGLLVSVTLAVFTLIAAGVLSVRRGRTVAQQEATDTYKDAAEAWEARYRAQQEELTAQTRRIDDLQTRLENGEKERLALRAEISDLRSRPDYDALVATVDKLAQAVQAAVTNEERIREHAHVITALGGALNLKLDAVLKQLGIPVPPADQTP